ncbi:uncharacterized protein UTRI_02804_B [Ustilago trichophora]|uniref:Uncharacterized protein n=1 Tax=Ustilago trichophora TaxID=86804 RepID=A0A5C3E692_9BASI|nr:uncharacterized protein UTRI_02804_B [Ustilago trichophora]
MSAARLLRASSPGLHALPSASLTRPLGQHYRSLHTTTVLRRRELPSEGPRSALRASTKSSSPHKFQRHAASSSASNPAARVEAGPSSAPAASTSGAPRHHQAKVEMIPFRVSTKAAKEYLTTLATTEVMPRVMSKWSVLKHQLLSLIGLRSMSKGDGQIVKLEKMTALYLPTWIVDASFEIKCRGNDGRAEANFITTSSRFPGHSWKPMDSMPMYPPPPHDMIPTQELQKDPNYAADTPTPAWDNLAMVDYESYETYLQRKKNPNVKIKGGIPDPVPFTISPLFLPEMLRKKLELKDVTFTPDLATGFQLPGSDMHGLGVTIALVNEQGEPITSPPVRFELDTFKLDMMAAYPILMPLHMAEFSYKDPEDGDRHYITMVLGAWDSKGLQFCLKEKDQDWQWSFAKKDPLKIDNLDLYPRAPIKTSLNGMFERERQEERSKQRKKLAQEEDDEKGEGTTRKGRKTRKEWEAEWEREDAENQKAFQDEVKSRMIEKLSSELPIKAAVEKRSLEFLQRADWIYWERDEREAFETRVSTADPSTQFLTAAEKERLASTAASARIAPTEPRPFQWLSQEEDRKAEREHPDRKAGLGRYIHWSSPHVQRLSHNVYANRRYLTEAIPNVLHSRKRMASITEAGHDIDRSHVYVTRSDGSKVNGEEAYRTIAADDISVRQQREALKPRWLKALQEGAGRR